MRQSTLRRHRSRESPPAVAAPVPDESAPHVVRPRLLDRLDAASQAPYTQLRAPAGWGKTVLLAAWVRQRLIPGQVVWLNADQPPDTFKHRLVAGIANAFEVDFEQVDAAVPDLPADRDRAVVVVIDAVDATNDDAGWAVVEALVRCCPASVRLVVSCRTDPALPLHRWRVAGSMAELGVADLAFTVRETRELLGAHRVDLGDAAVRDLHALTEGWPAALRLAALSLRDQAEPDQLVRELLSCDRGIAEYLVKEMLSTLPTERRRLLAEMSVVSRMSAGLVEALTGRHDGSVVLAELENADTGVLRCTGQGRWYHHHPLLAALLYEELHRESPQRARELHSRAAQWHADNGLPAAAIRDHLAAAEWSRATSVLEHRWPDVVVGSRRRPSRAVRLAPPQEVHDDPRLALAFAAERLDAGDVAGMRAFLPAWDGPQPVRSDNGASLGEMLTAFRVAEARLNGHHDLIRQMAPRLLTRVPGRAGGPDPEAVRAVGLITLGTAQLHLGESRAAASLLHEGLRLATETDLRQAQVAALSQLAVLCALRGQLRDAVAGAGRALTLAYRFSLTESSDLAWARLAMGEAYLQWNRLEEGQRWVDDALDWAGGDPAVLVTGRILQARFHAAKGSTSKAFDAIADAQRHTAGSGVTPLIRAGLILVEAELRMSGGDPGTAYRLVSRLDGNDPFPDWTAVVNAGILLAEGKPATAAAAVAPYVDDPARVWSLTTGVQAAILSALAGCATGERDRAFHGLRVALEIAATQGHRNAFVTARAQLRDLLDSYAPALDVDTDVLADLAVAMDREPGQHAGNPRASHVQPLTERERIVLRYLRGTMSNVEIAATLYVSVNTVKTHLKSIYRKLGTNRRREAVRRARDLRLI